jgi:hypothetical protein
LLTWDWEAEAQARVAGGSGWHLRLLVLGDEDV